MTPGTSSTRFSESTNVCEQGEPINEYAVVSYIPEQLGDFITRLRQELVPGCVAKSHVTILPPRPLSNAPAALEQLREQVIRFDAFRIEIPKLRVFDETAVIYAEIADGADVLREMHNTLNVGMLYHNENHKYHPHITLAQGLPPEQVRELFPLALERWNKCVPQHCVGIENLTFVQNTTVNRWLDLDDFDLRAALLI